MEAALSPYEGDSVRIGQSSRGAARLRNVVTPERQNLDSSQMASDDPGRFVIAIGFTVHPAGTSLHNRNPLCVRSDKVTPVGLQLLIS
jgi:hypothetical protein